MMLKLQQSATSYAEALYEFKGMKEHKLVFTINGERIEVRAKRLK